MTTHESAQINERFDLLRHQYRRYVLVRLSNGTPLEIDDIVGEIRAAEWNDTEQAIRSGLVHRDLPKLASSGVLSFDESTGQVRLESQATLESLLGPVAPEEFSAPVASDGPGN